MIEKILQGINLCINRVQITKAKIAITNSNIGRTKQIDILFKVNGMISFKMGTFSQIIIGKAQ